jgi:hypothetical protein
VLQPRVLAYTCQRLQNARKTADRWCAAHPCREQDTSSWALRKLASTRCTVHRQRIKSVHRKPAIGRSSDRVAHRRTAERAGLDVPQAICQEGLGLRAEQDGDANNRARLGSDSVHAASLRLGPEALGVQLADALPRQVRFRSSVLQLGGRDANPAHLDRSHTQQRLNQTQNAILVPRKCPEGPAPWGTGPVRPSSRWWTRSGEAKPSSPYRGIASSASG